MLRVNSEPPGGNADFSPVLSGTAGEKIKKTQLDSGRETDDDTEKFAPSSLSVPSLHQGLQTDDLLGFSSDGEQEATLQFLGQGGFWLSKNDPGPYNFPVTSKNRFFLDDKSLSGSGQNPELRYLPENSMKNSGIIWEKTFIQKYYGLTRR